MADTRRGFTLIELLVVIAIIAILAAILFPIFASAKIAGQRAACLDNLKQLGTSIRYYLDDYGRYPGTNYYASDDKLHGGWIWRTFKYVRNEKVYICPCTIQRWSFTAPSGHPYAGRTFYTSYSFNEYLQYQNAYWNTTGQYIGYTFESEAKIRNPSSTAMIADGYQHALFHDWNDSEAWPDYEGCPSGMNRIRFSDGPKIIDGAKHWDMPLVRHGGPNIVFCDLHVQSIKKDQFRAVNYPGKCHDPNGVCSTSEYPIVFPDAQRF
jgi:prepilin-type N-terminal cleavage/methylation domain-containing protein/prepilin-type processing-associated H-X9-DG protein